MFRWRTKSRRASNLKTVSTSLHFEALEDRRVLAGKADVVFVVDESGSGAQSNVNTWLAAQLFKDTAGTNHIAQGLASKGITDVQYGLVGYGKFFGTDAPAHSHVVLPSGGGSLYGNADDLDSALNQLSTFGDFEDGWDAIEHVVSEYKFRTGAIPVVVLVQNEDGRVVFNKSLTHQGVLASLESKGILLNTMIVGDRLNVGAAPVFSLAEYDPTSTFRVLGVEADVSGVDAVPSTLDAVPDGQHTFHSFGAAPTATTSDALQVTFNGSNAGATGMIGSRKSVLFSKTLAGGIGPNGAGYRAKNVNYSYEDMSDATILTDPTALFDPLNFGNQFTFPYFNDTYGNGEIWANEFGVISFGDDFFPVILGADLSRTPINSEPSQPEMPILAALWDNISRSSPLGTGDVRFKLSDFDGDSVLDLAIEWHDFSYSDSIGEYEGITITFQAVLYGNGQIRLNYKDIDSPGAPFSSGGSDATVGIWDPTATAAQQAVTLPAGKFVPGPHSPLGATFSSGAPNETNDSYIRMAWDTGGAAWDMGIVIETGISSNESNALRQAFVDSLANQILRRSAAGQTFQADVQLAAFNFGGSAVAAEGFSADPFAVTATNSLTTTSTIDLSSHSIPLKPGQTTKVQDIFKSARTGNTSNDTSLIFEDVDLSITSLPGLGTLQNGKYIVELLFAEIDPRVINQTGKRHFGVVIEGQTLLDDYSPFDDFAKISRPANATEWPVLNAAGNTGIVKRFLVDVSDADGAAGLQIKLDAPDTFSVTDFDPIISGIRILKAAPPRIENVVVTGSTWAPGVDYSFAQLVGLGQQLRPIATQNADTIEIHFDGPVTIAADALTLAKTASVPAGQSGRPSLRSCSWKATTRRTSRSPTIPRITSPAGFGTTVSPAASTQSSSRRRKSPAAARLSTAIGTTILALSRTLTREFPIRPWISGPTIPIGNS